MKIIKVCLALILLFLIVLVFIYLFTSSYAPCSMNHACPEIGVLVPKWKILLFKFFGINLI